MLTRSSTRKTATHPDLGFNSILSNPEELCLGLEKRFETWKNLTKVYISYFKQEADLREASSKNMEKALKEISIRPETIESFAPDTDPGILHVNNTVAEFIKEQSASHAAQSKNVEAVILKELISLKKDIKQKMKDFNSEFSSLNSNLNKHRGAIKTHYDALVKAYEERGNQALTKEEDPWLINFSLNKQLSNNSKEEESYMRAFKSKLNSLENYEKNIITTIKSVFSQHYDYLSQSNNKNSESIQLIKDNVASLDTESEWKFFVENNPNYQASAATNNSKPIDDLQHSLQKEDFLSIIKEGPLLFEHGFGIFKSFKEHYFILTNTGFLHAFSDSEYLKHEVPLYSINLGSSVLGPLIENEKKPGDTFFEITQKDSGKLFKKNNSSYVMKASSPASINEWWECISTKAYSTVSLSKPGSNSQDVSSMSPENKALDTTGSIPEKEKSENPHNVVEGVTHS